MKYIELRNNAGSQLIDDTYQNYRLYYMIPVQTQRCFTGLHVDLMPDGRRVCTFPYYDYANGKTYQWRQGERYPDPWCPKSAPNKSNPFESPNFMFGLLGLLMTYPLQSMDPLACRVQALMRLNQAIFSTRFPISGSYQVPCIIALGAAMPNIVYSVMADFHRNDMDRSNAYIVNLWQRQTSLTQQLYNGVSFTGSNVGYTVFQSNKIVDNEKFKAETFIEEAETAPVLYSFGLADSKITLDKGELIVRNERGDVIFNNRYDYMRILDYFHGINALALNGHQLYNSPKRFSYPGRKIAVVATSQNTCISLGAYPEKYAYNTGFWFPDPSTVEFTTCVSSLKNYNIDGPAPEVTQKEVDMASLLNVMILDVTGCTPGWKSEAETGRPYLKEVK